MNSQLIIEKPNMVIFLDIDGVLNYVDDICKKPIEQLNSYERKLSIQLDKEYGIAIERTVNSGISGIRGPNDEINLLTYDKAATHFFSKTAVKALDEMILKMQTLANFLECLNK